MADISKQAMLDAFDMSPLIDKEMLQRLLDAKKAESAAVERRAFEDYRAQLIEFEDYRQMLIERMK